MSERRLSAFDKRPTSSGGERRCVKCGGSGYIETPYVLLACVRCRATGIDPEDPPRRV